MNPQVSTRELDGCVVVAVAGELDLSNSDTLRIRLVESLGRSLRHVIVDLRDLSFIDSSGLSALVAAWKHAQNRGANFSLAAPQRPVSKVLQLTGLSEVFCVFPTVEAARLVSSAEHGDRRPASP